MIQTLELLGQHFPGISYRQLLRQNMIIMQVLNTLLAVRMTIIGTIPA